MSNARYSTDSPKTTVSTHSPSLVDEAFGEQDKKRSSRACDQCRRTKSKCKRHPNPSKPCASCEASGSECTFLGPSFKRGPPKGYIHALELRLRQVESIFGAILGSQDPRAQELIATLQKDDLARDIITRVEHGPFGPSGRADGNASSQEAFMAAITRPFDSQQKNDARSSSSRDSRITRESVSGKKDELQSPTLDWQESLIASIDEAEYLNVSSENLVIPGKRQTFYDKEGGDPTAIGKLAMDEHNQLRFHGESSGMPLLGRSSDRTDERSSGGLWRLPISLLARIQSEDISDDIDEKLAEKLPAPEDQLFLLELYFAYVHPILPVVHKTSFMRDYKARMMSDADGEGTPRRITNLLLLSMFSVASRYIQPAHLSSITAEAGGESNQAGQKYYAAAHESLDLVFRSSSITTVQSMILLSYRQFGLGSLEQAWIYSGIAIRMAQSLGLHRAADEWRRFGIDMFSPIEKEERKIVWWACAIIEKYISCSLGRPVAICERNFDTELPDHRHGVTFGEEEEEMWKPHQSHTDDPRNPQKAHTLSCLRAAAALSVIVGLIVDEIYSLRPDSWKKQLVKFNDLETRLDRWHHDLPVHLQLDLSETSWIATPHILTLHFQYWSAVILLHRKFIPERQIVNSTSHSVDNRVSLKSFELCQSAATHISALATRFKDIYSLSTSCAFAPSFLLTAGIVHIATLSLKPNAVGASLGLQQVMAALEGMERVWPSAFRNKQLLNGAKVKFDESSSSVPRKVGRQFKRGHRDAFGQDDDDATAASASKRREELPTPTNALSDAGTHWVAYMLGLEIPGVAAMPALPGAGPNTFNPQAGGIVPPQGSMLAQAAGAFDTVSQQQQQQQQSSANAPAFGTVGSQYGATGNNQGQSTQLQPWMWDPNLTYYPFDAYDFQSFTNPGPHF